MALKELSLHERLYELSPEEKKRRYREAVKPFVEQNFKGGEIKAENYIGRNDSPTAGLTKQNFARATEGYAANNDGTYRYRATRELKIPDQYDQNPVYAAKDRMQYYLIDNPNAFDSPRELKTANDYWGQIYTVMSQNSQQGRAMLEQAKYFSTQYGNPLYNPYQTSTLSKDIKELFGVDSFSAEWVAENYNLLNNLELTAAGKAKAPTSKSTPEQILAYHFSKIVDAEANTQKAEAELAALKQQITDEVAKQKTFGSGKSVDEIYEDLKLNDYSTLKAMENDKLKTNPYTLTRAVNYNGKDTVLAMIQAAMDKDDSDISGITDFTEYGGRYANEKYVDSQEKREQLYKRFYEDERERYRQEQDAVLTGDTSIQAKYDAREIPRQAMASDGVTVKATDKNEEEPEKPKNWQRLRGSSAANAPEPEKKETEKPEQQIQSNIDPVTTEAEIKRIQGQLEASGADGSELTAEDRAMLESQLETLQGELRAYKYANPEEYVALKYVNYKNDPEFYLFAEKGATLNREDSLGAYNQYSGTYADPHFKGTPETEGTAMTAEEIAMYDYLLAKEGPAAADEYVLDMQQVINARQGKKVAEAGKDDPLGQVLYNYSAGAISSFEGLWSAFSDEVRPVGASDYARAEMAENNGDVQNLVNDMASGLGYMTPGLLVGWVTGGLGGAAYIGVSGSGNAYQDAMRSGAMSKQDARNYGLLVGASEALLSYALGGISKLGGKATGKLINSINKIDNVFLRASAKMGANMVSEGFEEYLQAQIEPLLQNWLLGMDNDINAFSADSMYAALMGVITAVVLEGCATYSKANIETRNQRSIGKGIIESNMKDRLIERAKASDNADVREAAEAIEAGTLRATESTLGQLAIEYHDNGGDVSFLSEGAEADVQPTAQGITTDYDSAMALSRAMRGEATESDLDLLEESLDIPNHEDTVNEISAAAKELSGISKRYTAKEEQMLQLKQDIDTAQSKVDDANSALGMHLRGVVRMQNGEVLGREVIAKHHLESQIEQLTAEAESVTKAGLDPVDQNKKLETLKQQLAESQVKIDELTAGHREITAFQGQVVNAQKSLDAANRNYSVAEMEMDRLYYEYKAASDKFQNRVANAVNTAFGQNAMGMLEQTANNILAENTKTEPIVNELYYFAKQLPDDVAREIIDSHEYYTEREGGTPEAINKEWDELSKYAPDILNDSVPEENRAEVLATFADAVSRANDPNYNPVQNVESKNTTEQKTTAPVSTNGIQRAVASAEMPSIQASVMRTEPDARPQERRTTIATSLQTSMDNAANALGVGLQKGRTNYQRNERNRSLGYHNPYSDGINIQTGVDMPVFAHEVGHSIDQRYNIVANNQDVVARMVNSLPQTFRDAYGNNQDVLTHEAIAEFVSMFVTNPVRAEEFAGTEFYNLFTETLSRDDLRTLERVRTDYNNFINADIGSQIQATIHSYSEPTSDGQNAINTIITNFIDKFNPLRQVDQSVRNKSGNTNEVLGVEGLAKNALYAKQTAEELITGHMFDPNNNAIAGVGSFTDALSGLRGREDYNTFVQYCKAKHAIDWAEQGRDVFTRNVDYRAFVNQIETNDANQKFVEAHKQLMRTWDAFMKSWVVNEGFISREAYDQMRRLNPNYVPNIRVMSNANGVQESGGNGTDSASPRAGIVRRASEQGSTLDTYDPIESMIKMVESMVATQRQNAILREFDTLYRTQEGMSDILMPANKDMTGTNVSELLNRIGRGTTDMDIVLAANDLLDALGDDFTLFNVDRRATGPRVINAVRRDGSVASYEIQSQAVYDSLVGVAQSGKDVLSIAAKVTRTLNSFLTVKNPLFWIPNASRDVMNLFTYGTEENPLRVVRNLGRAFGIKLSESAPVKWTSDVLRNRGVNVPEWNNELYQQYHAMGGGSGQGMSLSTPKSVSDIKNSLVKGYHDQSAMREMGRWMSRIGNAVESVGDFIEDNTRFAEFLAGLEKYGTDSNGQQLAFRKSRTVTTEFAIQGKTTRGLNTFFRFCSANINGNYQQIRQLTDASTGRNGSKIMRNLAYSAVLGTVAELMLHAFGGDEYEKIADDVRMTHWCIPTSMFGDLGKALGMREGDYIRLPKPQGVVQSLFNLPAVLASGYMSGELEEDLGKGLTQIAESINPFSSPIWSGVTDALRNRTYYGDEIESSYLEDLPVGDRYNDTTPDWAIKLAKVVNATSKSIGGDDVISPMKLQYIVEQYSGVMGKVVLPFVENFDNPAAAFGSILNSFSQRMTVNGYYTNDIKNEYKANKKELNEILTTYKKDMASTALNMHLSEAEREQAIIDLENLLKDDDQLGGIEKKISEEWDIIRTITDNTTLTDEQKERETLEHRKNIYNYQAQGNLAMEMWLEKYGPERNLAQYIREGSVINRTETKWKSIVQDMPESFQSESANPVVDKLRSFWEQDTAKTSFKPTYPPDFVKGDKVMTAWDDVDSTTKQAMEKAWTTTYIQELTENGFASITDYKKAKEIASDAKSAANKEAKEIYTIKYGFREDED